MGHSIGTVIGTLVFDFKGMYRIVTLWAYELCCCGFLFGVAACACFDSWERVLSGNVCRLELILWLVFIE